MPASQYVRAIASPLSNGLNTVGWNLPLFYAGLLVFAAFYLVYNYGLYVLGFLMALVSMVRHAMGIW